jgi:hypothetical protein
VLENGLRVLPCYMPITTVLYHRLIVLSIIFWKIKKFLFDGVQARGTFACRCAFFEWIFPRFK